MTHAAPIGQPRVYDSHRLPILYPGEVATARLDPADVVAAIARGETEVPVRGWTVEPMPGWKGRWLRWRYRLWGRWWRTGTPKVEQRIWME